MSLSIAIYMCTALHAIPGLPYYSFSLEFISGCDIRCLALLVFQLLHLEHILDFSFDPTLSAARDSFFPQVYSYC